MQSVEFTLLDPKQYHATLLAAIGQAQQRVLLNAMVGFWDDVFIGQLFREVLKAQKRGVQTWVVFDQFSFVPFGIGQPVAYTFGREYRKRRAATRQFFADLRAAGGRTDLLGHIGLNPFKGRYHAKISLADAQCFSFGGINLTAESFANHDYMLWCTDTKIADALWKIVTDFTTNGLYRDVTLPVSGKSTILFDAGIPGSSAIYQKACELTAQARRVRFVSQMCPTDKLAALLEKTDYQCFFTRPSQAALPYNIGYWFDQSQSKLVNSYTKSTYIHAKYMLFELHSGATAVLTGSNNFSWRGIRYGTQEIALLSTDNQLYNQLTTYTQTHIAV